MNTSSPVTQTDIEKIFSDDPTGEVLVGFARRIAHELVQASATRTQIRGVFTEVRRIQSLWVDEPGTNSTSATTESANTEKASTTELAQRRLQMLRPRMAYQAKRNPNTLLLVDVLEKSINQVFTNNPKLSINERFSRFMDLFEAILAYHRAHPNSKN